MATANETRGEIGLLLDGVEYVLRPSRTAIVEIEKATGLGLVALANLAGTADMTLETAAKVVTPLIRAGAREDDQGGRHANVDRIGELIFESEGGLFTTLARVHVLLMLAATGGYTAEGEAKAAKPKTGH